jgi:hypothetical protein
MELNESDHIVFFHIEWVRSTRHNCCIKNSGVEKDPTNTGNYRGVLKFALRTLEKT